MIRAWLADVFSYAKESWREAKELRRQEAEDEYNRLNPSHGPLTQMQSMLQDIWAPEILRQTSSVQRFNQFVDSFARRAEEAQHEDV